MYIQRNVEHIVSKYLKYYPVIAIIGPRQCGKSTLIKKILENTHNGIYLDLELPSDLRKLEDAEQFFAFNQKNMLCIDEIQRRSELFSVMRAHIDKDRRNGQFLISGSASPDLLKQSSESLAGRISYIPLTPLLLTELSYRDMTKHWLRGGFPNSFLSDEEAMSYRWRQDFINTYLERDIPSLGLNIKSALAHRLWTMLAHTSGQVLNKAKLSSSLGISSPTVQNYLDMLEKTFMLRVLKPYYGNTKKRLIKSPKVYLRDTGILHTLLDIPNFNSLLGHPVFGQSWETYVIEQILATLPDWTPSFFRSSDGTEVDLVLNKGQECIAVEIKASSSPKLGAGFYHSLKEINPTETWVICPFQEREQYPVKNAVTIASLNVFLQHFSNSKNTAL